MTIMHVLFYGTWGLILVALVLLLWHLVRDMIRHERAIKRRSTMRSVPDRVLYGAPSRVRPVKGPAPHPYDWSAEDNGGGDAA